MSIHIHPSADVSPLAKIGENTSLWHQVQVREGAQIGAHCILSKGVYVDTDVVIGNNVKIQNYVSIYHGVIIEDGVFIGPHVCFKNDLHHRAVNPDGSLKSPSDWEQTTTLVCHGASIGANYTIRCGTTIGTWAMIGAGSLVTHDIPDHCLVWGNSPRLHGFVCMCGKNLSYYSTQDVEIALRSQSCNRLVTIPAEYLAMVQ